jgi:hypothetical protein
VFVALKSWGERWTDLGDGPVVHLTHELCGRRSRPRMTCDKCGEPIRAEDMRYHVDTKSRRTAGRS